MFCSAAATPESASLTCCREATEPATNAAPMLSPKISMARISASFSLRSVAELDENHAMTVFMSRRHADQAKHRHHFRGRHSEIIRVLLPDVAGVSVERVFRAGASVRIQARTRG
jgi:hypothetical protein